ncbi:MAG: type II toxin-antitoxin system RelE/ParE family toxin [Verrucomicrobia bacterium]|nr:type II toxin-antitoxin system RelE/ParE family toxin [Verrucomicrobiota bacterium]
MVVEIEDSAERDLIDIYWFYEDQELGAGGYFLAVIRPEIMGLAVSGGVHRKRHGFYFCPSPRFPHGFYYLVNQDIVKVYAVLDCRRNPRWIRHQLKGR